MTRLIIPREDTGTITIFTEKIVKQPQTITFPTITGLTVGTTGSLTARSTSGLPIVYESADETMARIEGSTIIPLEDGQVTLIARQLGNIYYLPAEPVSITVSITLNEVLLPSSPIQVYEPESLAYFAADGVQTLKTRESLDKLIKRLKINNLWNDVKALWVGAGYTRRFNVKNPQDTDAAYRLTFPNGVGNSGVDDAMYFYGDRHANTHLPLNALNPNDYCLFAYVKNRATTEVNATGTILGAADSKGTFAIQKNGRSFQAKTGTQTLSMFSENPTPFTYTDATYVSNVRKGLATYIVGGAKKTQAVSTSDALTSTQPLYLAGLNQNGQLAGTSLTDITLAGVTSNLSPKKVEILYKILNTYTLEMGIRQENESINYGDSISYGNNASDINTKPWRVLVAQAMGLNHIGFVSIGATLQSINGATNAAQDRWYPDNYQYSGFIPYNDSVRFIYLALGINDAKNFTNAQNPLADFDNTYRALIGKLMALGWPPRKIVVLNTGLVDYTKESTNQPQLPVRQAAINAYIKQMCTDYNLRFVDVYTAMQQNGGLNLVNTNGGDGLHPNDAGHKVIADAVISTLVLG
ncbi:SGNH/GDSL hydrolase family protein [Siphonobacter sp. SORGH_AS_0500]|uniref:SGNH/GDSL hydrolase family protein n=1 Tax=Siphonobacter sp. SORGH_AS_0500 TaxID=1864824 RepID=UPI00285C89A2|nr:SGNH/GDSL hydrolase family protein [Siphonobacter sp. SORGH_AS_0500]MDR6195919.1 lysophospholipase L1-like esterase [Siphonobacter sp. SORGH_AS_0500]